MHLRIGSIVIDCNEFDKMMTFWQETLHYVPKYPGEEGWVLLRDPKGIGLNVGLNKIPKSVKGRIRLHLDLYADDGEVEVRRLLKTGATLYPRAYKGDEDYRIMVDPEGNHFCVVASTFQNENEKSRLSEKKNLIKLSLN